MSMNHRQDEGVAHMRDEGAAPTRGASGGLGNEENALQSLRRAHRRMRTREIEPK